MYRKVYRKIKKYDTIVIARHIGVDPDALASQLALKESIELTFPQKKVYAIGNGSSKFNYIGKLDKLEEVLSNALLIVVDTPDKKRIDAADPGNYEDSIKIDHHPYIETFANLEWIDDTASSACQLILELLFNTRMKMNQSIARKLYIGLVCDTNRFSFKNSTSKTFSYVAKLLENYPLDIEKIYQEIYMRPLNEFRLQGYIAEHLTITDHGVAYIKLSSDLLNKFNTDPGAAGNIVNNFNYVEDYLVWIMVSEDSKNDLFKINIRSRGPEINRIAEKYNGGGHKFASGVRVPTMEDVDNLIEELDTVTQHYIEDMERCSNENK